MSIFEYDKEEEERKLRKAEYESGVADGFNDGINTAKKDTVRLHIAKSSCAILENLKKRSMRGGTKIISGQTCLACHNAIPVFTPARFAI